MKYIIKMTIDGEFPGSPDHDYFEVDENTWDKIRDLVYPKFIKFDTEEDLQKSIMINGNLSYRIVKDENGEYKNVRDKVLNNIVCEYIEEIKQKLEKKE